MMGQDSKIEWTHHTFNPWRGCAKVSPGCEHCYAATFSQRNPAQLGVWGANGTRVLASEAMWREPLKWNAAAAAAGERHRVFCASLADVFEDWVGEITAANGMTVLNCCQCGEWWNGEYERDPFKGSTRCRRHDDGCRAMGVEILASIGNVRRRLFQLIDQTPHLDWLLLTKRPENVLRMWVPTHGVHPHNPAEEYEVALASNWRPNVWLGTSVENQDQADKRIPELLKCRHLSPVLFLSVEPMLSQINMPWEVPCTVCADQSPDYETNVVECRKCESTGISLTELETEINWVICGGESGPSARPMHPDWARSLRDQCHAAGVLFFFKQWGEYMPCEMSVTGGTLSRAFWADGSRAPNDIPLRDIFDKGGFSMWHAGKKLAGRVLDGRTWDEFPVGSGVTA